MPGRPPSSPPRGQRTARGKGNFVYRRAYTKEEKHGDALLAGRLTHCTICGKPGGRKVWTGIWTLPHNSVAYIVCEPCGGRSWQTTLGAIMTARYKETQ